MSKKKELINWDKLDGKTKKGKKKGKGKKSKKSQERNYLGFNKNSEQQNQVLK